MDINDSWKMELVELGPQEDAQIHAENNIDNSCETDKIINVDAPILATGEFQNEEFGFQSIPSSSTATTTDSSIRGVKQQVVFQGLCVFACCLLLIQTVRKVISHFDLSTTEIDIFTLISFAYDISLLVDRVRFFILIVNFIDIQPSMKFICSRMAAVIDNHVTVGMESRFGYILLGVAALAGILETATNLPCLNLPLGKLLLELAGIVLECFSSIFQVMTFEMTVIILAKKVEKMLSNEFELNSCQASTSPKEILKLIMTGVRTLVAVHYWVIRGYDLHPVIVNWWSSL